MRRACGSCLPSEEIRTLQYLIKLLVYQLDYVTLSNDEISEVHLKLAILQSALNESAFAHLHFNFQQC